MAPAIARITGYATVCCAINVIALKTVTVRCGNVPPCVLKLAIIIGKVNRAIRRRVLSSDYPAIRRGVGPPAGLIRRNKLVKRKRASSGIEPIPLKATVNSSSYSSRNQPPLTRSGGSLVIPKPIIAALIPAWGKNCRRLGSIFRIARNRNARILLRSIRFMTGRIGIKHLRLRVFNTFS